MTLSVPETIPVIVPLMSAPIIGPQLTGASKKEGRKKSYRCQHHSDDYAATL